jgi:hypothetical protein
MKPMTVRFSDEEADLLETISAVEGRPIAELLREAVRGLIADRRSDAEFRQRLKGYLATRGRLFEEE